MALQFQPLPPLSLVSTALTVQLTNKQPQTFQTGYLTMDQKKRVLPVQVSDPAAFKYPLIGVWAIAVPNENKAYPFTHPLVWAACVRYITSAYVHSRVSPDPDSVCFLFVYFGERTHFYEVHTQEAPVWATTAVTSALRSKDTLTVKFLRGSPAKPPRPCMSTSSEGRLSTRESWPVRALTPTSAKALRQQGQVLQQLQAKIRQLQAQVHSPPKSPSRQPISQQIP